MVLHASGEDYLEAVLILQKEKGMVRSVDLALQMGYSKPSISHAVGILKESGFLFKDKDHYVYDIDKANELLDEAGWIMNESTNIREKDGETLSLKLTLDSGFDSLNQPLATLLQTQLGKVGIKLSINSQEQMEWYSGFMAGDFDLTFWQPQYNYAAPHCWFTPMDTMTPQTFSLQGMEDSQEFLDTIKETIQTDNEAELRELFTYLYNYDMGNVIDIPLTYQKDMIVYNTNKISGYDFIGTPCFFDVMNLHPAE